MEAVPQSCHAGAAAAVVALKVAVSVQRRVMRQTERMIDAWGQHLVGPQWIIEGWTTSVSAKHFDPAAIVVACSCDCR